MVWSEIMARDMSVIPTLCEREKLMAEGRTTRTGFSPRSNQKLCFQRPPRNMLSIECRHVTRCDSQESVHGYLPLSYQMWLEAGKHPAPFPERPDPSYNSNVWRNFRQQYGFQADTSGQKMNELIASMYPLNIPAPSQVGEHSYSRFLTETPLIRDDKLRTMAIDRTSKDIMEFKRLRLKSEARQPPLDKDGRIMPPVNFKRYAQRFEPLPDVSEERPVSAVGETRVDIFGNVVPRLRKPPHLWKLTYRLNNPEYEKLQQELQQRKTISCNYPPPLVSGTVK